MENTMAKIYRIDNIISICTYSRSIGHKGRFMINAEKLDEWLERGGIGTFYDRDLNNYLTMRSWDNVIQLDFKWLNIDWCGNITGKEQRFLLRKDEFEGAILCEKTVGLLSIERPGGKVWFANGAQRNIGLMDKQTRRAFSKAMRRGALCWPETQTEVFADGKRDFFFKTNDGMCGGLICHEGSRNSVTFGVHT